MKHGKRLCDNCKYCVTVLIDRLMASSLDYSYRSMVCILGVEILPEQTIWKCSHFKKNKQRHIKSGEEK